MDWENSFAVSEREVTDIKIRHRFGVFFSLQNETKNGTKSFSLQKYFRFLSLLYILCKLNLKMQYKTTYR